jgi:hypothetical protein
MKFIVRLLLISFLLTVPLSYGCSKYQVMRRQENQRRKEMVKEKERRDLEDQAAYEQAMERHYSLQTKETRKAMRINMKKSIALKENKKPCFLIRWFTPKQKKKPPRNNG